MNPDDHYAPPKTPQLPVATRKRLGPVDWLQFFLPALFCVSITFLPLLTGQMSGEYPLIGSGLLGIAIGATVCLFVGVIFGQRMKTGGPFLSSIVWIIIVTAVNSAVAWGGCAAGLSAL